MRDAMGRSSALDRVLFIPELLDLIFGMLDRASNATCAQVCKTWSSRALDVLWREVDDLCQLFSLLAPLTQGGNLGYEFAELPDANDWKRFEKYSLRVRRLEYDHPNSPKMELRQTVFDDVARTRLRLDILPNMHTLVWKGPLNLSITFMHAGVKTFEIWLPDELEEISPQPFFQDITVRMPNITKLNIKSDIAVHDIEADLINLIGRLPKLHVITFPRFYITTKIMEGLSRLPNLEEIEFQYDEEQGCGNPDDVVPHTPTLEEGAFPCLYDLSLTAGFDDISRFLSLGYAPTNLTSIYVDSGTMETASSIQKFLSVVAGNCQLLKSLALISFRHSSSDGGQPEQYKITFNHLKPVFKLPNLKTLEVLHHHPLALNQEDLELLASSWPSLEWLNLNNEPVLMKGSHLTLEALLPFARHCPNLTRLGLFIDASVPKTPPPSSIHTDVIPFKQLKRLSMGVSIIDDNNSVALYLSHILPSDCVIECGVTWDDDEMSSDPILYREVHRRCGWWDKADNLLPVLVKLRLEEKERFRVMENELDDLRMRNELLVQGVKSNVGIASSCIVM